MFRPESRGWLRITSADPTRPPSAEIRALGAKLGEKPLHTDWGIALLSALAATVAMGICAFFWIVTAWPEGANAVAIAAVSCTLFASLDDPAAVLKPFATIIGVWNWGSGGQMEDSSAVFKRVL